jgi:hypothetical protein
MPQIYDHPVSDVPVWMQLGMARDLVFISKRRQGDATQESQAGEKGRSPLKARMLNMAGTVGAALCYVIYALWVP